MIRYTRSCLALLRHTEQHRRWSSRLGPHASSVFALFRICLPAFGLSVNDPAAIITPAVHIFPTAAKAR